LRGITLVDAAAGKTWAAHRQNMTAIGTRPHTVIECRIGSSTPWTMC
jgi:hypothetical protein